MSSIISFPSASINGGTFDLNGNEVNTSTNLMSYINCPTGGSQTEFKTLTSIDDYHFVAYDAVENFNNDRILLNRNMFTMSPSIVIYFFKTISDYRLALLHA